MDLNLVRQLENDFDNKIEVLLDGKNHFIYNEAKTDFLYCNQDKLAINCVGNSLLVRSSSKRLLNELEETYFDFPAAWFMEMDNIFKLQNILKKYDMSLNNMGPIMATRPSFTKFESDYEFKRIDKKDYNKFKGLVKFAFSFDEEIFDDQLVLSYYDGEKLIAIAGASRNSKYLWDIGVEKFDFSPKYKEVTPILINNLALLANKENPDITVIYTSQFSHVNSINLAIRAGYQFAFAFILGG